MTNNETLKKTGINDTLKSSSQVLQNNKRKAGISNSQYWGRLDFSSNSLNAINTYLEDNDIKLSRRKRRALKSLNKRSNGNVQVTL